MKKIYIIPEIEVVNLTAVKMLALSGDLNPEQEITEESDFGTREFTFDTEDYDEPFDW